VKYTNYPDIVDLRRDIAEKVKAEKLYIESKTEGQGKLLVF